MNNYSPLIREIIMFIESEIYKVAINGLQQRLLWYKIHNLIRKYPDKLNNLATIISIGNKKIIRDVLEYVDLDKIIDLEYLILNDEYEYDDDLELIQRVKTLDISKLQQLPQLIKCNNCDKFNIHTSPNDTLCSCGFIPI